VYLYFVGNVGDEHDAELIPLHLNRKPSSAFEEQRKFDNADVEQMQCHHPRLAVKSVCSFNVVQLSFYSLSVSST
jgi:hypothetical protein